MHPFSHGTHPIRKREGLVLPISKASACLLCNAYRVVVLFHGIFERIAVSINILECSNKAQRNFAAAA
jgi:hypothetical protein